MRSSYIVFLLWLLINHITCIEILPYIKQYKPNPNLLTYFNNLNRIRAFQEISRITLKNLFEHGVVKIPTTQSVIFSEDLAEETMSPVTRENTRSRSIHTGRRLKLYKLNFLEVSFENASFKSMMHASTPLGKCINNYSKQPATYLQGWAIEAGAAANLKIDFATFIIDLHPTTKVEFGASVGLSGLFSCDVPPGHPLQFALTSERYEILGVRQRRMRITRFGLQEEEWEEVPTFTKVNTRNIQIACITDPRLVRCPPLVH